MVCLLYHNSHPPAAGTVGLGGGKGGGGGGRNCEAGVNGRGSVAADKKWPIKWRVGGGC